MVTAIELQARVDKLALNMARLDQIVNGDVSVNVTVDSGLVPSYARLVSLAGVYFNASRQTISADTAVDATHDRKTIVINAVGKVVTAPAAASLSSGQVTWISNPVSLNAAVVVQSATSDFETFRLWPGQLCTIYRDGSVVAVDKPARWALYSSLILYASQISGSDDNDGLVSGRPVTMQRAIDILEKEVDCKVHGPSIQVIDPVFNASGLVHTKRLMGNHVISINGDTSNPGNRKWQVSATNIGMQCRDYSGAIITGFQFEAVGSGASAFRASQFGVIDYGYCWWETFPAGYHIDCSLQGAINANAGQECRINGGALAHFKNSGGKILASSLNTRLATGLGFGEAYLSADNNAITNLGNLTFTGGTGSPSSFAGSLQTKTSSGAVTYVGGQELPGNTSASGGHSVQSGSVTSGIPRPTSVIFGSSTSPTVST